MNLKPYAFALGLTMAGVPSQAHHVDRAHAMTETSMMDSISNRLDVSSKYQVPLMTKTVGAGKEEPKEYFTHGTGVVVGDFVFTVDHVVSKNMNVVQMGPMRMMSPINKISETTFLYDKPLEEVVNDSEKDVAVFHIPSQYCEELCNDLTFDEIALKKDMYQGQDVFMNASPRLNRGVYRESKVAKTDNYNADRWGPDTNIYVINPGLWKGTSGTDVWSYDRVDGKYKLSGIAIYTILNGTLGGIRYMDEFVNIAKEFKDGKTNTSRTESAKK